MSYSQKYMSCRYDAHTQIKLRTRKAYVRHQGTGLEDNQREREREREERYIERVYTIVLMVEV